MSDSRMNVASMPSEVCARISLSAPAAWRDCTTTQSFDMPIEEFDACLADDREWQAELDDIAGSQAEDPLSWRLHDDSIGASSIDASGAPLQGPREDVVSCDSPYGGSSSDGQDRRSASSTHFEVLLLDCDSLKIDWSRQSTHWSLSLKTADATTFDLLDRSRASLSRALEAGFASQVSIEVVRT